MPQPVRALGRWSCRASLFGLGESDVPRPDPRQHGISRSGGRQIVVGPWREVAVLFLELVSSPAVLVAQHLLDRAQFPKENDAISFAVGRRLCLAAVDEPKLALDMRDVLSGPLWQEAAGWTRLPTEA